ncbi:MAG: hypothetical protein RMK57_08445 [Bryobacterales bacterium]|nr:hypothetical protein [Bryobacteraceae bacterium]MDW8354545.1 hypothetical protein [Bryobacterales bacterium]
MNPLIVTAGGVFLALALVLLLLARRVLDRSSNGPSAEWLRSFDTARYRPMERLLSEADFAFLASQVGYEPRIGRKLRAARRRIFRQYLRCLRKDFARLEACLRWVMVHSEVDRADLARALRRQKLLFFAGLLSAEGRLLLHGVGLQPSDVRRLVGSLDLLRGELRRLAPVAVRA